MPFACSWTSFQQYFEVSIMKWLVLGREKKIQIYMVQNTKKRVKQSKVPERRIVFCNPKQNAVFEKLLQILNIVLSIKLISFLIAFFNCDLLVHILLSNISPFCNQAFPTISHTSSFGVYWIHLVSSQKCDFFESRVPLFGLRLFN